MKSIEDYIFDNKLFEVLSQEDQGNNKLIDETDDYNLYWGGHLIKQSERHVEDTFNPSEKISLESIKDLVKKGFYKINDNFNAGRLKQNDENSAIILTSTKHTPYLNVIMFIKNLEPTTAKYNLIVKTVMKKNNFIPSNNTTIKRVIEKLNIEDIYTYVEE